MPDGASHVYTYTHDRLTKITDAGGRALTLTYDGNDRLISLTTPSNQTLRYAYDTTGRLVTVTYPDSTTRQYLYEDAHFPKALTGIIDQSGVRAATFTYDTQGRGIASEHANGTERTQITYEDPNHVSVTNALGQVTRYEGVIRQGTLKVTKVDGQPTSHCLPANTSFRYDLQGHLIEQMDWQGALTRYEYDTAHRVIKKTVGFNTPDAQTTQWTWYQNSQKPLSIIFPNGLKTTYAYNDRRQVTAVDVTGKPEPYLPVMTRNTRFTYNDQGQLLSRDGPRTDVQDIATYTYTPEGFLASIKDALGGQTTFTNHTAQGLAQTQTLANGLVINNRYDTLGRLVESKQQASNATYTTTYQYDPAGRVVKAQTPSEMITYAYDPAGRVNAQQNALGDRTDYQWSLLNQPLQKTLLKANQPVYIENWQYDEQGRLIQQQVGNHTTTYTLDAGGRTVTTTEGNATTRYRYDPLNRLIETTEPGNRISKYQWDKQNAVTKLITPQGEEVTYTVNDFGEQVSKGSNQGEFETFKRDSAGLLIERLTGFAMPGQGLQFKYDALGRLISRGYANVPDYQETLQYDKAGHLTEAIGTKYRQHYQYNPFGQITQQQVTIGSKTYTTTYQYNANLQLNQITYPTGRVIPYTYNANNQITSMANLIKNITWQPNGPIQSYQTQNGRTFTNTWDSGYQLTKNAHASYQRDTEGRVVAANANSFTYSNEGWLQEIKTPKETYALSYSPQGLLTQLSQNNQAITQITYLPSGHTQQIQTIQSGTQTEDRTYLFDSLYYLKRAGKAQTLAHDHLKRLQWIDFGSNQKATYQYNYQSQRLSKTNGSQITHFHYDLAGNLIAETDATGKAIREYIYLNNQPVLLLQNNQIYDYQNDHLGTPQKLTDSTNKTVWEATYTPLGEAKVTTSTIKNPLRYPGQYFDEESGFHYNWHRYYDPKTGQYLESDPLGSAVSPFIYGYAENDWVNKVDPMGLETEVIVGESIPILSSVFGHVAIRINDTVYSRAHTKFAILRKLNYMDKQQRIRDSTGYVLTLSPSEERKLENYLKETAHKNAAYSLFNNSCASVASDGLEKVGIRVRTPGTFSHPMDFVKKLSSSERVSEINYYRKY